MAKCTCRLDNGGVVRYSAAFPLDSKAPISKKLWFIGTGFIVQVGAYKYRGKTRLQFYATNGIIEHGKNKN